MATVLIIDDDNLLSNSEASALKDAGFVTQTASNGRVGLEIALAEHPDVILLDYQMPEMDGLETLAALREDEWGKTAKVVFATNVYDIEVINQVLSLGVPNYILKSDSSLDEIVATISSQVTT